MIHLRETVSNPRKEKHMLKSRITELSRQFEEEQKKSEDYLNRLKYLQADFENYQKRVKREREDIIKMGSESIIRKILSVLDEMEIAIAENRKISNSEVVRGLELILSNLLNILKQEGLTKIDSLGKAFDASIHEAVSFIETDEVEENMITREIKKGYLLNDKLIRPSLVEVARKPVKTSGKRTS